MAANTIDLGDIKNIHPRVVYGLVGPLLQGMSLLAQRAADWTVPAVIDGAFEAWPTI